MDEWKTKRWISSQKQNKREKLAFLYIKNLILTFTGGFSLIKMTLTISATGVC